MNGVTQLVGVEEGFNLHPDRACRGVLRHHHVHKIVGKGGMQPHDDGEISLHIVWVGGALICVNVSTKIVLTKHSADEEILQTMITGGVHIKNVNTGFWLMKPIKSENE